MVINHVKTNSSTAKSFVLPHSFYASSLPITLLISEIIITKSTAFNVCFKKLPQTPTQRKKTAKK